jgi:UDP-N-acetylmuramyl pentapeptide synthase
MAFDESDIAFIRERAASERGRMKFYVSMGQPDFAAKYAAMAAHFDRVANEIEQLCKTKTETALQPAD